MEAALISDPHQTAAAIWGRVIMPDRPIDSPDLARSILKFTFSDEDQQRIAFLLEKNREAQLTQQEQSEIDEYLRVDAFLSALQSKARATLKKAGLTP